MCVSFDIKSSTNTYQVTVGTGLVNDASLKKDHAIHVVDSGVLKLWPILESKRCIAIEAVEEAKTLDTVAHVIEQLRTLGANRNTHLVAVGGGIIQDIATFAASTYMRGIEWTYFPTTLLGMVDSCIGGKSSINVGQYKNIAGNFYPPKAILIDPDFCNTLSHTDRIAGLCEAVKICFADQDEAYDNYLALIDPRKLPDSVLLANTIELSLRTKKTFIEEDEFDQGIRLLLNFGHTFGHALEAASHFEITHGVAVGLGMLVAMDLSKTLLSPGISQAPRVKALETHIKCLLKQVPGLGEALNKVSGSLALEKFKSDKKHRHNQYAMILIGDNGYLKRHFINADSLADTTLTQAFDRIKCEPLIA
jgi:3-dehydroquinate synthase